MSVVFVDTDFLSHNFESNKIENQNATEVESIVECQQGLLGIHTPLYIRNFKKEENPLSLFPELINNKKYIKYDHPTTYLVQMDPKDEGIYYLSVQVESTSKEAIPNFYVPFNYNNFLTKTSNDFIDQIKSVFTFEIISPKLFVNNVDCANLKGSDIFNYIINKKSQLIMKCELTDAGKKVVNMRQNVLAEIISTENTYISDLQKISGFWKPRLEELKFLTENESRSIFKDIDIIISYQITFRSELESRGTLFSANIADVFIMFSHFFKSSKLYISNYQNIVQILTEKEQKEKFTEKIEELSKETGGRDLASYLITPVQRMPRYILFLRELLKYTPTFHPDRQLLEISYNQIEKVTREIDKSSDIAKRQQELYRIQVSLNSSDLSILQASRNLEKKRKVKLLHYPKYTESNSKTKFYLFNDLIVIIKKSNKRYAVFYSPINKVSYIRNLPTFDSVTFCTTEIPSKKKSSSLQEFCSIRFESPQARDEILKLISSKLPVQETDYFFKDIAMSYLPPILSGHKTSSIGSIIYSFGGYHAPKDVVAFDISNGAIDYQKALLPVLEGHSVSTVEESIYICGGEANGRFREETWKWNPTDSPLDKNNKRNSKSILIAKTGFAARINQSMSKWEDKLVVFGGKGTALSSYYNSIAIFDTTKVSDGWVVHNDLQNLPQARCGHTSVVYNDKMYIYGGKNDKVTFSDINILNLNNLEWETQPQLTGDELPPRAFHQSIVFEDRPVMFTIGGNEDTSTAHLVNLETFSVTAIKITGNVPPSLSSFTLTLTHEGDLIIIGGKVKDHPTNLVQLLHIPETEKSSSEQDLTPMVTMPRKKANSVICKPVAAEDKEEINYVLESQKNIQNNQDDEIEYEYEPENEPKKENNENKVSQSNVNEKVAEKPANEAEKPRKTHKQRLSLLRVSKDDFSLPTFINILMFVLPALAVLFISLCGLSKFTLIGSLICIILIGLLVLFRKLLIERKARVLENVLSNEIKNNDGYANKVAFLLKYNVPACVFDALMKNNEQTKKFTFTSKTVDGSTFDAIELAK